MTAPRSTSRDRKLTPEEAAKYNQIRRQVAAEKPEILQRSRKRVSELGRIGQQFRNAREAASLTLAELCERTGIDKATLSRFENGVHGNPTLATMTRYAEALGMQLEVELKKGATNRPAQASR
jgi:DNA-binding XRE family transcriptional regulator